GQLLVRRLREREHQRQRAQHRRMIDVEDERAAVGAAADPQDAELLERSIRFPDGDAAGLVLPRHLALGRQLVTGYEPAVGDLFLDAADDRFRYAALTARAR